MTGGHLFFLLQHARRTGFLQKVAAGVRAGEIAYAGMSAGGTLAAQDFAHYRDDDDPGQVTDTAGLGLIDFYPLPHANRGREELYAKVIADQGDRYVRCPPR